ncbi:MAG TPA: hypothetical protein VIZ30_01190, partial [Pseudomonadales bacterium]
VEQLAFTPYPYEDVGDLIRQSDDRLYLFSSDYPHIEGGKNPLGRFEASDDRLYLFSSDYPHTEGGRHPLGRFGASLAGRGEATLERFYAGNFASLFGM